MDSLIKFLCQPFKLFWEWTHLWNYLSAPVTVCRDICQKNWSLFFAALYRSTTRFWLLAPWKREVKESVMYLNLNCTVLVGLERNKVEKEEISWFKASVSVKQWRILDQCLCGFKETGTGTLAVCQGFLGILKSDFSHLTFLVLWLTRKILNLMPSSQFNVGI